MEITTIGHGRVEMFGDIYCFFYYVYPIIIAILLIFIALSIYNLALIGIGVLKSKSNKM